MTPRDMNMAHVATDDDDDNVSVFYSRFIICIRRMELVNRKHGTVWFAQPRRKRTRDNEPPIRRFIYTSPRYDGALCIGVGVVVAIWKHVIAKAEQGLGPRLFSPFLFFFSRPPPPARPPQAAPALTQRWCEPCRCMTAPMCDRSH